MRCQQYAHVGEHIGRRRRHLADAAHPYRALTFSRRVAEALQILPLLLVPRRQLEQPRGGAAEDVVGRDGRE
jgi:hypothetical protein